MLDFLKQIAEIPTTFRETLTSFVWSVKFFQRLRKAWRAWSAVAATGAEVSAAPTNVKVDSEKPVVDRDAWAVEKKKYKLRDFGGGTFAQVPRRPGHGGEPDHRLCTNCFDQGHKSTLQSRGVNAWQQDLYFCPRCKTMFPLGERKPPPDRPTPPSRFDRRRI